MTLPSLQHEQHSMQVQVLAIKHLHGVVDVSFSFIFFLYRIDPFAR